MVSLDSDSNAVQQAAVELLGPKTSILELLGLGSFGRVYRIIWHDKVVALKIILDNAAEGEHTLDPAEAVLGKALRHPNLVASFFCCQKKSLQEADSGETESRSRIHDRPNTNSDDCDDDFDRIIAAAQADRMATVHRQRGQSMDLKVAPVAGVDSDSESDYYSSGDDITPAAPAAGRAKGVIMIETWIVMEYMDLGCLRAALKSKLFRHDAVRPKFKTVCKTLSDIARGMQFLHLHRVIHGDLTTKNIMLQESQSRVKGFVAKIGDFGLSRTLMADDAREPTHLTTNALGCMTHMAPELLLSGRLSPRADIYSFGIIMWEVYTSRTPYQGLRAGEIINGVTNRNTRPIFPDDTPVGFRALAQACWDGEQSKRPEWIVVLQQLKQSLKNCKPAVTSTSKTTQNKSQNAEAH